MTKEKIFKLLNVSKDYILFILIFILYSIPFFKGFYPTANFFMQYDYPIIEIIGIIGVYFLIISLAINFYKTKNKKQYFIENIPIFILSLYMIWTFISCFLAENREFAFLGTEYRKDGYFTYLAYAGVFGLAFCMNSKMHKKILLYTFPIIAVTTIVFIQIAKYANLHHLVFHKDLSFTSFGQFNHYGYYLLIAISISSFLFISEKNKLLKIINILMYTFLLYFLILNDTFGCYLALITTFLMFFITTFIKKSKKLSIIIAIIIFVIVSIFTNKENINKDTNEKATNIASQNLQTLATDIHNIRTTDSSDIKFKYAGTGRMMLWQNGLKFFKEKPILGYGAENLGDKYKKIGIPQDRPHNLFIQLATTSGFPGLILYTLAIRYYIIERL